MCPYLPALVCFAVRDEAAPFRRLVPARADIPVVVTGMGAVNATAALDRALTGFSPALVVTCGFAGGLNPQMRTGTLLYTGTPPRQLEETLASNQIQPGKFHLADRVAVTAQEKALLWRETGADVVEMESLAILGACRTRGLPCLVLRVVLDAAGENLPLDFNQLLTPDLALSPWKLGGAIARAPWRIPALLQLQRQSASAARILANALSRILDLNGPHAPGV